MLEILDPLPFGKAHMSTNAGIARIGKKSTEKWPQSEWDFAESGEWKRNGNVVWTEGKGRYESVAKRGIGKRAALKSKQLDLTSSGNLV